MQTFISCLKYLVIFLHFCILYNFLKSFPIWKLIETTLIDAIFLLFFLCLPYISGKEWSNVPTLRSRLKFDRHIIPFFNIPDSNTSFFIPGLAKVLYSESCWFSEMPRCLSVCRAVVELTAHVNGPFICALHTGFWSPPAPGSLFIERL